MPEMRNMLKLIYDKRKELLIYIVAGLAVHMLMITNYYPSWDDIDCIKLHYTGMFSFGRWLTASSSMLLSSPYDLRWVNGLVSLVLLALTLVPVLELFELKSKTLRVAAGILFMAFPTVASSLCYMAWAPAYSLGYFLSIAAIYICIKGERRLELVPAAAFICAGLCIYQIYATTALVCALYYFVFELMRRGKPDKPLFMKGLRVLIATAIGGLSYLLVTKLMTGLTGIALSSYQGISSISGSVKLPNLQELRFMISTAGHTALQFFGLEAYAENPVRGIYGVINALFLLCAAVSWLIALLDKRLSILCRALELLGLVMTVFMSYVLIFVSGGATGYHMVMQTGMYFVYLGVIVLIDRHDKLPVFLKKAGVCILFILCFYHFVNDNTAYKQRELSYNRSVYTATQVLSAIDARGGRDGDTLVIIGSLDCHEEKILAKPYITGALSRSFLESPLHFREFLDFYFDRDFVLADEQTVNAIEASPDFHAMDCYPCGDYVKLIDGCVVVKLSD